MSARIMICDDVLGTMTTVRHATISGMSTNVHILRYAKWRPLSSMIHDLTACGLPAWLMQSCCRHESNHMERL
jgi:hypothetical protein